MHHARVVSAFLLSCLVVAAAVADDKDFFKPKEDPKDTNPSGKAEMLRLIPKKWGVLQAKDEARRQVTILFDGDKEPATWSLIPDAELKLSGWWARLRDFHTGDRVWVWFDVNRKKEPRGILMMCDELTQQDMNDRPFTLAALDVAGQTVTLKPYKGDAKSWKLNGAIRLDQMNEQYRLLMTKEGGDVPIAEGLKVGAKVYVRTSADTVSVLLDAAALDTLRNLQRQNLRTLWSNDGLPGTVVFLHPLSGEMELMLDHEAMRWGRHLKLGDKVKIKGEGPIAAAVKEVRPWRERTQVRLVVDGLVQHDLALGQRVLLLMRTPPAEVDTAELPPDIDRPRTKPDRVEWFLASIYCSCTVGGNGCTGMFYTLSSCNIHGCGMPNAMRAKIGGLIDRGQSDRQIWDELKKTSGTAMLRPHLVP